MCVIFEILYQFVDYTLIIYSSQIILTKIIQKFNGI